MRQGEAKKAGALTTGKAESNFIFMELVYETYRFDF
jgi:hypothetical protein